MEIYKIILFNPADYQAAAQYICNWLNEHFQGCYDYVAEHQEIAAVIPENLNGLPLYDQRYNRIGSLQLVSYV